MQNYVRTALKNIIRDKIDKRAQHVMELHQQILEHARKPLNVPSGTVMEICVGWPMILSLSSSRLRITRQ